MSNVKVGDTVKVLNCSGFSGEITERYKGTLQKVTALPTNPDCKGCYIEGKPGDGVYLYRHEYEVISPTEPVGINPITCLPDTKSTNPKDAVGVKKVPITTVPFPVICEVGLAMLEGARKYGRHNYRIAGVRASVYIDAVMARHLMPWWEGEDLDPDSGLSHITKAIAGLCVLRDSMLQGNWNDDRPPASPAGWKDELNTKAAGIIEKYPDCKPPFTARTAVGASLTDDKGSTISGNEFENSFNSTYLVSPDEDKIFSVRAVKRSDYPDEKKKEIIANILAVPENKRTTGDYFNQPLLLAFSWNGTPQQNKYWVKIDCYLREGEFYNES